MATADGAVWITYNGEIYNYRELRQELSALGFELRTTSDTEVILAAYEAWGVACLGRLRGMFAFAIWDARRRQIFMARDRVGIKPLVYAWDGQCLRFASEIKALLEDPAVPRELDWMAVRDYLTHHYVSAPRTIFRGIHKLPPASYLLCSLGNGEPKVETYWDVRMAPDATLSEGEWTEQLEYLLSEAVQLHMVSDVPVGAFLSGGIDSSSVVALMARASASPVKTFSIGFDEQNFDELRYARLVAKQYGTDHFEMVVKPDVVDVLPRLAWQFDEPFADASAVPTYCVAKITREHVTVALSGDGGDESFAGYRRYAQALNLHRRMDRTPAALTRPLLRWIAARRRPGSWGREFMALLGMSPLDRYHRMMTYQSGDALVALLTPDARTDLALDMRSAGFEQLAAAAGTDDYLSMLQYIDIHHYLPGDILTKVDLTSMLTSLEARVPLLDHVVMEHAARIPPEAKIRNGSGKHVLKQAMRSHLPAEILDRQKMGFGVPLAAWFRKDLKDFARDLLSDRRTRERGIFQTDTVSRLLDMHIGAQKDYSSQLWSLICLELWFRTWWDR